LQRLNSLLFTSDLDVLGLALNLLLRPSQQYSAQPAVSQALNISTSRLSSLAKRWPSLREYGVGLVELVNPGSRAEVEGLPSEAREVNYSFYRLADKPTEKDGNKMEPEVVESAPSSSRKAGPAAASNAGSRLVNIHIDERTLLSKEPMEILAEAIDKYALPDAEKFEILCRIRSASALSIGREVDREKLVVVRLLAIAIFGHTHDEAQATSSLFLHEPDLIVHVAELLQLGRGISFTVQTAAIAALDALARYRNRVQEVLTAVNAGVNHGILMALVRRTVTEVADSDSSIPQPFVEALLSFVTFLATHAAGGNMVVGAGLIPLLIQVIENKLPQRLAVVSKTMQLVDNVLYSFSNAFQLFANARGVEVLVDRIEVIAQLLLNVHLSRTVSQYEVDFNIKEYAHEQRSREMYGSYGGYPGCLCYPRLPLIR
jgi:E3 ubiquitin-protein ligase HUWE1